MVSRCPNFPCRFPGLQQYGFLHCFGKHVLSCNSHHGGPQVKSLKLREKKGGHWQRMVGENVRLRPFVLFRRLAGTGKNPQQTSRGSRWKLARARGLATSNPNARDPASRWRLHAELRSRNSAVQVPRVPGLQKEWLSGPKLDETALVKKWWTRLTERKGIQFKIVLLQLVELSNLQSGGVLKQGPLRP